MAPSALTASPTLSPIDHERLDYLVTAIKSTAIKSSSIMPQSTSSSPVLKVLDGDTFKALLVRSKHAGINAIVMNDTYQLDPTIADASCEMRPPLVLDMRQDVRRILREGDTKLVATHRQAHGKDKPDTQVYTVFDAQGASDDAAYLDLIRRVEDVLGEERISLLTLSHYFTSTSVWAREEQFNFQYSFRSKARLDIAGEEALRTGNPKDNIKMEQLLRSQLAIDAIALFMDKVSVLPRYMAPTPGMRQALLENQLSAACESIRSGIPFIFKTGNIEEKGEIPLMPIFNQILALLYMSFQEDRKLVFRVFRSKMTPIPDCKSKQRYVETFAGAYLVVFEPDHLSGHFRPCTPTENDMNESYIVIDCFSKYIAGTSGHGLDSSDLEEHRHAFESSNLAWLLMQYAAAHPAYTNTATDKKVDFSDNYEAVCTPQSPFISKAFRPSREHFDQFKLNVQLPGQSRPNLHNLWRLARQHGEQRSLHNDCQIVTGPHRFDLYERLNRPVDWQPDHIYTSTLRKVDADMHALVAKHRAAPGAVFGPFIVRAGSSALSFVDEAEADRAIKESKTNKRKNICKKVHPENMFFIA
ncbi:hypothetical protein F5X68DRAFT_276961 [Plectosphaerella plurivora]|uniref:Uncharacterized protein n=1 Tax=Plectosphaerella plurivora TaxID=936078 RepID=A0A9P9A746_9PEZI|nr:hypothetical protein F5X68DRAFT_276961 [Plectosphaerella plurivora]